MKPLDTLRRSTRWLAAALALTLFAAPWVAQAAVSGNVKVQIDLTDIRTSGIDQTTSKISQAFSWDITNGAGANQVNLCWQGVRTISSNSNEDLDLAGSLTNLFGAAVFTGVKFIAIQAALTNTTTLTVSRPSSNGLPFLVAAGDAFTLGAGDFVILTRRSAAGVAVTADTGDLVNVANSTGASGTYTIVACGKS